jgi:hypothetical protein
MGIKGLAVGFAVLALSAFWLSSGASAFCGTVQASATGASESQALSKANSIGLKETGDLDRKYGNRVKYQQAKTNCSLTNSGAVSCKITQQFCVDGGNVSGSEVDPNSAKCKTWQQKCNSGNQKACTNYESNCQND